MTCGRETQGRHATAVCGQLIMLSEVGRRGGGEGVPRLGLIEDFWELNTRPTARSIEFAALASPSSRKLAAPSLWHRSRAMLPGIPSKAEWERSGDWW